MCDYTKLMSSLTPSAAFILPIQVKKKCIPTSRDKNVTSFLSCFWSSPAITGNPNQETKLLACTSGIYEQNSRSVEIPGQNYCAAYPLTMPLLSPYYATPIG